MSLSTRKKKHGWAISHPLVDAKDCQRRVVDHDELVARPWLRGTCHTCLNYEPEKHLHHDSPMAYNYTHPQCVKAHKP